VYSNEFNFTQIQGENSSTKKSTIPSRLKYRGMVSTMLTIAREEGTRSLYKGLVPGIHRQMCFASIRIGLYDNVKRMYGDDGTGKPKVVTKILSGITTGIMAVSCAQPTEVVKIRMQASGHGARYKSAMNAYRMIGRMEGVRGLWKGSLTNISRLSVINVGELVTYDLVKTYLVMEKIMDDKIPCHFVSAFVAGFVATVIASPVDVVKTRYMNSKPGVYKNALNCAVKMFNNNGPTAFYKGFTPNFLRVGTWNVVMFICYEQFKKVLTQRSS